MEATKNPYNHYSAQLKPKKLERGQRVTFRIAGSFDPETEKYRLNSAHWIPNVDIIYDKYKNEHVSIALVEGLNTDGTPKLMDLWLDAASLNTITLTGGKVRDELIYEFFMLTDFNVSKPDRDPSKNAVIELVDEEDYYRRKRETVRIKNDILALVDGMSDEEVKDFLVGQGVIVGQRGPEWKRMKAESIMLDKPHLFLDKPSTKAAPSGAQAIINKAQSVGVLTWDRETFTWSLGEEQIASFRKTLKTDPVAKLGEVLADKPDLLERIKAQIQ